MEQVLVCLHGWGGSKESFTELQAALQGTPITILTPDLPGFGKEPEPLHAWSVDEYADWVMQWILSQTQLDKKAPVSIHLLGHSHGGRIALKLAYRQSVRPSTEIHIDHLYLCAAAGIRHPRHIKRIIGLLLAKTGKFFLKIPGLQFLESLGKKFLYKLVRVHDYERASPIMRETLIRVSRENLRPVLQDITIPTDIFWGKDDKMTPFSDALVMEREIKNSILHAYEHVRHSVHRDQAQAISFVIQRRMSVS